MNTLSEKEHYIKSLLAKGSYEAVALYLENELKASKPPFNLGKALLLVGCLTLSCNYSKARQCLDRYIDSGDQKNRHHFLRALGNIYFSEGDFQSYIKVQTSLIKLLKNNITPPETYEMEKRLVTAHEKLEQYDKAIKILEKYADPKYIYDNEKNRKNIGILFELGMLYGMKAQEESCINSANESIKNFRKYQDDDPANEDVKDFITKMIILKKKIKNKSSSVNQNFMTKHFDSISQILNELHRIKSSHHDYNRTLLFRGHENSDWNLTASIYRQDVIDFQKHIKKYTDNFKMKCGQYTKNSHLSSAEEYEVEAYMQHYGIPTRYLDWSESPMISLYFALSKNQDFTKVPITEICLWVLDVPSNQIKPLNKHWSPSNEIVSFLAPDHINERISRQKGYFTYVGHENGKKCLSELIESNQDVRLHKLILNTNLHGESNFEAKSYLNTIGVSPTAIYPDLQGLKDEIIGYSKEFGSSVQSSLPNKLTIESAQGSGGVKNIIKQLSKYIEEYN